MKGGLGKWFGENWVDIKTGEKCGRSGSEKAERAYPACRPARAASRMTSIWHQYKCGYVFFYLMAWRWHSLCISFRCYCS